MVFKRRTPRTWRQLAQEAVWPRGGWSRAAQYVKHRLTRLPDEPHRIARGVFAGVFISFTPLFGFHFVGAALLAWILRGNILAALLATFVGNPVTMPLIAFGSVEIGHWMLGIDAPLTMVNIFKAFSDAGTELWANFLAIFTEDVAHWRNLARFFETIYLPYLVGGILPGLVTGFGFYYLTIPVIRAYQKLRSMKAEARRARLRRRGLSEADDGEAGSQ
ncbi:DUF2062 domain-containing protein [Cereibacter azotoformans]|uniref:DUF2062 domain-containing protein n=2 Tax=Cereibacter TaxID=1653176 RepID=A0A2T5K792_9RHOB|nr:DUF2062 domain-containing protein [Cereibacter azotoformans]AXQ94444.1 DUF2062 domain-containing protein [Cereibacter sphaeroides]MBO4170722.1 DUF2062 domain-containing protein [Cereibacter azotoformans]PTR18295.1 hypothetical protein C8J28_10815 [Cereibacter azotoformans]UIJ29987.1 DUF2062 domain-containing protein [Cereibacter azotoformans]ULB10683.1 DUF2062 domain-containing protein [Cereibacter azotoformans]